MKILIVEDDDELRALLVSVLEHSGYSAEAVADAEAALPRLAETDLLITDINLPGMDGLELLRSARDAEPSPEVLIITGFATIATAVEAIKNGARDYITKPFSPDQLLEHVDELAGRLNGSSRKSTARRGMLVGVSARMEAVFNDIDLAAGSNLPVLITGETGTGKELAARAIHDQSTRSDGKFVAVNLGAIPENLAASELFGHEQGAFTGADKPRKGRFLIADGGTLFLDEINSLPLQLQPQLLRALESDQVWPVGADTPMKTDIRVIAATNANLQQLVEADEFREDLYYRLNVLTVKMPALRARPEDIPVISRELLDRARKSLNLPDVSVDLTGDALSRLLVHSWPGNVRQLSNKLRRALAQAMAHGEATNGTPTRIHIDAEHFDTLEAKSVPFKDARGRIAHEWARPFIREMLKATDGNVSKAARRLQMSRTALVRLVDRYDLAD